MAALAEKNRRTVSKSNLTRNINKLNKILDAEASIELVKEQFNKVRDCYNKLEQAHDEFLLATDVDIDSDPAGIAYMNEPDMSYETVLERYAKYEKLVSEQQVTQSRLLEDENLERERKAREDQERIEKEASDAKRKEDAERQFENAKSQLTSCIAAFNKLTVDVNGSIANISSTDQRNEWTRVESEFSSLKEQFTNLLGIDHSLDVAEISKTFEDDAEQAFLNTRKVVLPLLKDVFPTSGGSSASDHSSTSTNSSSHVRRELVGLPEFEGKEESSPYLRFPIWKQQWDVLIQGYEDNFRATLLLKNTDQAAQRRFIGFETKYEEAMARLVAYYGVPNKVVACVMGEVNSQLEIEEGDYRGLVAYSDLLESNYSRLKAMGEEYEHEMSNSTSMSNILKTFPMA